MCNSKETKIIAFFIATAFILPLLCIVVMTNNTGSENSVLNFALYGLEAASPSVAAIAAIAVFNGKKGIIEFFGTNFTPRMNTITILAPILISFGIMFTAKAMASLFMNTSFQINHPSGKKLIVIAWAFIAEEFGWRGLLHKKMALAIPEPIFPLILGLIWSAWHYHFFIMGGIDVPIALFIAGCIADSYIYLFLLKLSQGNILIAMLYHLSGNLFLNLFCINPNMNEGSAIPYTIFVIITGILGIGLNVLIKNEPFRHFLSRK